jgi:hypothetical protein
LRTISHPLWKAAPDEVYLQEIGEQIVTAKPVTAVAVHNNKVFLVTGGELKAIQNGSLVDLSFAPKNVRRSRFLGDALWAAAENGVYRLTDTSWHKVDSNVFTDFCLHLGQVYGATRDDLFRFDGSHFVNVRPPSGYLSSDSTLVMEDFSQMLAEPVTLGPIERIASYSGTLYLLRQGSLAMLDGKTLITDPMD